MPEFTQPQKAFLARLGVVIALVVAGAVLSAVARGLVSGMETVADMNAYSWLGMVAGLLLTFAAPVAAIITLRYGKRHEAAIREHRGLSMMLTAYRILFWLWVAAIVLLGLGIFWLGAHIGPVR